MRKIRKRILAVALAAVMLVHIPGTASYAEQAAGDVETPEIAASVEVTASAETEPEEDGSEDIPETAADTGNGLEPDAEKTEKEETAPSEGEGKDCGCVTLCTENSVNGDCPVCGAEGADLSACRGEEQNNVPDSGKEDGTDTAQCICGIVCTEDSINGGCPVCGTEGADLSVCEGTAYEGKEKEEETTEVTEPEEAETEDTNLCAHHKEHTQDCGFVPATEDSEGSPCTYACRICPIEDLIAALPDEVTADNADDVRAQLDEILSLFSELTEEEQEQIDLSHCYEMQGVLDEANEPVLAVEDSGDFGAGNAFHWSISEDGTLTITGTGDMPDFQYANDPPWFNYWKTISKVEVQEGVTSIGKLSFYTYGNLSHVDLPDSLTSIGDNAFHNCGLTMVTIPENVTTIGKEAFYGCDGLTEIIIPDNVTAIGERAFVYCDGLTEITIPDNVTTIGNEAFYGCNGLAKVIFEHTIAPELGEGVFGETNVSLQIVVPAGATGYDGENWPADKVVVPVAKVVKQDGTTTYVANLADAFADANSGATVTLVDDVELAKTVDIPADTTFVLDLNGYTISTTAEYEGCIDIKSSSSLTIKDSRTNGTITSADYTVNVEGEATLEGGRFLTDSFIYAGVNVAGDKSKLSVTGENVYINCLDVSNGNASLSAGTYDKIFASAPETFAEYLAESHAYYKDDKPLALNELVDSMLAGPVTVKECSEHGYVYDHTPGAIRHSRTCRYCGYKAPEPCAFTNGRCVCGAELMVELADPAEVKPYTGAAQEPGVTVTVDGQTLDMAEYKVRYANNLNAGKATVTVTGIFAGEVSTTFSIGKATPTLTWENDTVELTYTGRPADIKPIVTLVNGEIYNGEIIYNYGFGSLPDMPTNVMTYASVKARIPEQTNYTAAESGLLSLTILPADQAAPAAPAATDENIKDTSITLTAIDGAEYSKDNGATWQGNPTFTGLTPNTKYTFCARMKEDRNHNASPASAGTDINTKKSMLDNATVTMIGKYTYNGTAQTPEMDVVVMLNEEVVSARHYTSSFINNINAGTATVTITASADGDYSGSASTTFLIRQAPLTIKANDQTITYGNSITLGAEQATATGLCTGDTLNGITLNPSTINVPGGTITPSAAQIKNGSGEDVTANYEITYQEGKLTINRAEGKLTVPETQIIKTFGEGQFLLNCSSNSDGKISYTSSDENVASVSEGGTVLIKGAGEATITVSLGEGTNHTGGAKRDIRLKVIKAGAPAKITETRNYTYLNGSRGPATIDIAGKLPGDRGETEYTYTKEDTEGILSEVSVDADGNLVYTVQGNKKIGDTASITVTAEMANYETTTFTVKIVLVEKKTVEPQAGSSVSADGVLIYGQRLSELKLADVVFVEQGTGEKVEGNLTWKDGSLVPDVKTTVAEWIFMPEDSDEYTEMTGTVPITVAKATPDVKIPVAETIIYNPSGKLGSVALSGGSATWIVGGSTKTVEGTWGWQSADTVPTVDNSGYAVIFIPKDTANYETVTRTLTVQVTKAVPYIADLPKASEITYGDALSASALSGGTVQYGDGKGQAGSEPGSGQAVQGTFTWKTPATRPIVADSDSTEYEVLFTPSDTVNYETARCSVKLAVKKAPHAPNMPGSAMDVPNSREKVGDVPLPEGWEWQESDRETALEVGVPVTALAVYTEADRDNYENTEVRVTITRSACDHTPGDILYTGKDEKAPTCTEAGLGHRECTKCGSMTESGIAVDALGHTGGTATCSKEKVCTRCGEAYGGTDGSRHGDTEIRGFAAATCMTGGYTGDTYCIDCGAKTGSGTTTPALGHDYRSEVTKEPTTGSEGTRTYTCTRCGDCYTESIPKLPEETHTHFYTENVTKQPTCTDAGTKSYTCSCGDSYTETIAALGHHYLGSETKKPTTTTEGIMTYTCTRCGHSYTSVIEKLPDGEKPEEPGDSSTEEPGDSGTEEPDNGGTDKPGNGSTEENRPGGGIPFIKGEDGKTGWDVIRAEEDRAEDGDTIHIDMNGSVVVPGDIFARLKGRDITITFDMGDGILWSVDGKSITRDTDTSLDNAGDVDFSVKKGVSAIPVDIVNNVTGERYSIQISLAYEGEFGFTAVLSMGLGKENAGYTASLYYYNESTRELEFICKDTVAEDGTVSLSFTHASDYVIVIDGDEEESEDTTKPAQPETPDGDSDKAAEKSPQTGQEKKNVLWLVAAGIVVLVGIVSAGVHLWRKKEEETL